MAALLMALPARSRRVDWEALLAQEGMPAEPKPIANEYRLGPVPGHGRLHQLVVRVHHRAEDARAYYALASDYLWRVCRWSEFPATHRAAWELHCEGRTVPEIAAALGVFRSRALRIVQGHAKLMRGRNG